MQTSHPALPQPVRSTHERAGDAARRAEWSVGARSETGFVRSENEDRMARVRFGNADAFTVFDGMGGHASGALAAELAMRTFCASLAAAPARQPADESLREAFARANEAVYARSMAAGESRAVGMGATAVALVTSGSRALVAHVGDSRAYLMRRGRLTRLTRDHSRVQRMVDAGMLTDVEALNHPDTSVIERAVGHQETLQVDIAPWLQLRRGDQVLLCSDGLCGYASDAEIEAVLRTDAGTQALADALVELALSKGGHDNVTVQLVRYGRAASQHGGVASGLWTTVGLIASLCVAVSAGVFAHRTQVEAEAAIARLDLRLDQLSQDLRALRIAKAQQPSVPAAVVAAPATSTEATATTTPPQQAASAPTAAPVAGPQKTPPTANTSKAATSPTAKSTKSSPIKSKAIPQAAKTSAGSAPVQQTQPETAAPVPTPTPAPTPTATPEVKPEPTQSADPVSPSSGLPAAGTARAAGTHGLPPDRRTSPSPASVARAPVPRSPTRPARREARRAIHARRRPGGARPTRRVES